MRIAILGATSQIARDFLMSYAQRRAFDFLLYVRDRSTMLDWLVRNGLEYPVFCYAEYGREAHDAVINFVGVGDPQRTATMGGAIFGITQQFDDLVLEGLKSNQQRRYIFMSSGAALGSCFMEPARQNTRASIAINALPHQEYYSVAKLHAECKHRALSDLSITDVRVFNYFSRTQNLSARFFITDILRAIRDGETLNVSSDIMVRDFLHPTDFCHLVECILAAPAGNRVLDCYTRATIDKPTLLGVMEQEFGLQYKIVESSPAVNATGCKPYYYSINYLAAELGYDPIYSSQDGVVLESKYFLGKTAL